MRKYTQQFVTELLGVKRRMHSTCRHSISQNHAAPQRILFLPAHILGIAFLPLQFHVIGDNSGEIVVAVLAALPVGNVCLHTEKPVFHLPHSLVCGNGYHVNGEHHVPVQIGQLGCNRKTNCL